MSIGAREASKLHRWLFAVALIGLTLILSLLWLPTVRGASGNATMSQKEQRVTGTAGTTATTEVRLQLIPFEEDVIKLGLSASLPAQLDGKMIIGLRPSPIDYPKTTTTRFLLIQVADQAKQSVLNVAYALTSYSYTYSHSPQFSPDGKKVFFKVSPEPDPYTSYAGYLLDIDKHSLRPISSDNGLIFVPGIWSRDSQNIAIWDDNSQSPTKVPAVPAEKEDRIILRNYEAGTNRVSWLKLDRTALYNISWASNHSILYASSSSGSVSSQDKVVADKPLVDKPLVNVYESNIPASVEAGQQHKEVIRGGWRPLMAPDGKWIAFFGPEDWKTGEDGSIINPNWQTNPRGAALSIMRKDGSERKILGREQVSYPSLLWTQDSKSLISFKTHIKDARAEGEVKRYDLAKSQWYKVCTLYAKDYSAVPRSSAFPPFHPKGISNDGQFLFVLGQEIGPPIDKTDLFSKSKITITLFAVRLSDGAIYHVFKTDNPYVTGVDWHDTSPSKSQ